MAVLAVGVGYRVDCDCGGPVVEASSQDAGFAADRVGYWKFDEPGGTALIDSSGHGNTGYLGTGPVANAALDPVRVPGLFDGGALFFDGGQPLCTIPGSATLDGLSAFTYVAWIYPTGWGGSSFGRVLSKESDAGFDDNYVLVYASDYSAQNGFGIELDGAMVQDTTSASNAIVLHTWQQVAVTYDDATDRLAHLYLNGIETPYVTQPPVTGALVLSSHAFVIGNRAGLDRGFAGMIDEVQVYATALTASDIASLYDGPP
jgi:hypothetical protein